MLLIQRLSIKPTSTSRRLAFIWIGLSSTIWSTEKRIPSRSLLREIELLSNLQDVAYSSMEYDASSTWSVDPWHLQDPLPKNHEGLCQFERRYCSWLRSQFSVWYWLSIRFRNPIVELSAEIWHNIPNRSILWPRRDPTPPSKLKLQK